MLLTSVALQSDMQHVAHSCCPLVWYLDDMLIIPVVLKLCMQYDVLCTLLTCSPIWVGIYVMAAASISAFAALVLYQHHTYPLYISISLVG